jgi:hypothetical protein
MSSWLFLTLAVTFSWLAYDAYKLEVPSADVPYALTAEGMGQDVSHVSLQEQAKRKAWNERYGIGNLNLSVWLWLILALACAVGSVLGFLA